jgi:hypothetical protein
MLLLLLLLFVVVIAVLVVPVIIDVVDVVVPMAEMVEKLSHHCCGIPVEFDGILELLLIVTIILGIPVPPGLTHLAPPKRNV